MDNIKKFEDFLDRMQGLLDSAKKQGHIIVRVEDLENTFPELKESEDEKIKKVLIDLVNCNERSGYKLLNNIPTSSMIAWLEKQESVEEIVSRCKTSWYNEGKIQGQIEGLSDEEKYQQGWHDALEKQGEQTDINPSEFDLRLNKLLKQFETLPKEELVNCLSFYLNVVQNDGTYKPADWNEEDEDIRDTIIRDLKRLGGDMVTVKPAYKEEVDWLKSLKRRIGWKPTKEQMEALHDLNLTGNISYAGQGQVLIELYNDLKKL